MYPGNVLILDRATTPCQDVRASRKASPYAALARPGTFPRHTSSQFRHLDRSAAEWRDLSFHTTQSLYRSTGPTTRAGTGTRPYQHDAHPGRGSPPWLPFSSENLLTPGNPRTPQGVLAHRFNHGSRAHSAPLSPEGEGQGVRR